MQKDCDWVGVACSGRGHQETRKPGNPCIYLIHLNQGRLWKAAQSRRLWLGPGLGLCNLRLQSSGRRRLCLLDFPYTGQSLASTLERKEGFVSSLGLIQGWLCHSHGSQALWSVTGLSSYQQHTLSLTLTHSRLHIWQHGHLVVDKFWCKHSHVLLVRLRTQNCEVTNILF